MLLLRWALPRPPPFRASARPGCPCPSCAPPCARKRPAISPRDASPGWAGCGTARSTGRGGARRGIFSREAAGVRTWAEECARAADREGSRSSAFLPGRRAARRPGRRRPSQGTGRRRTARRRNASRNYTGQRRSVRVRPADAARPNSIFPGDAMGRSAWRFSSLAGRQAACTRTRCSVFGQVVRLATRRS